MKQKLTKKKIESSTITVGHLYTPLSIMDTTMRQKISKKTEDLNNTVSHRDLRDIYRTLYPTAEYTFFSRAHETFSRKDHTLGHKINLNTF